MLFHIRHHHEPDHCIAHKPEDVKRIVGGMMAKAKEGIVSVHSFVVDPSHHDLFWVVEADSAEALNDFLDDGLEWGKAECRPVLDGMEAVRARSQ